MSLKFTNKEQERLFESNVGFAFTLSKEWADKCKIDKDDLYSYALEALATAAIKYDYNKNDNFKCFARMIINQRMQRANKSYSADKRQIDNNAIIGLELDSSSFNVYNNIEDWTSCSNLLNIIEEAFSTVDERMVKATKLYIYKGKTQKEIAKEMGIAIMTVSQWISKTKKVIADKLIKEGIIYDNFFKNE